MHFSPCNFQWDQRESWFLMRERNKIELLKCWTKVNIIGLKTSFLSKNVRQGVFLNIPGFICMSSNYIRILVNCFINMWWIDYRGKHWHGSLRIKLILCDNYHVPFLVLSWQNVRPRSNEDFPVVKLTQIQREHGNTVRGRSESAFTNTRHSSAVHSCDRTVVILLWEMDSN